MQNARYFVDANYFGVGRYYRVDPDDKAVAVDPDGTESIYAYVHGGDCCEYHRFEPIPKAELEEAIRIGSYPATPPVVK